MAWALTELFPGVLLIGGKTTEFGFYYDFIAEQPIDANAIDLIEEKLRGLIKQSVPVHLQEMMRENAAALLEHKGQPIRAEAVRSVRQNIVSVFHLHDFYDYCTPPYIDETSDAGVIKILSVEPVEVYVPEEGHAMAVRVKGTVFPEKDSLKKFLKSIAAAKKNDHCAIAKEMDLFAMHEKASDLSYFWHPHGSELRNSLEHFWREEHRRQGFNFLASPSLVKESLIIKSGFFEGMAETIDTHECVFEGTKYCVPPTLSPLHALVFASKSRTHHELPIKFAECAQLSTFNKKGELGGIFDSKLAYSDRAHIFCAPVQLEEELISSLHFIDKFIKIFGFEYHWYLGGRRRSSTAAGGQWNEAANGFIQSFSAAGFEYGEADDESLCTGPFAEAWLRDSAGREWKGPRIGADFTCPARLNLRYQSSDGKDRVPIMLERMLYGTYERFTAILTEHYAGVFPLWLTPEQARVIPVGGDNMAYAEEVCKKIVDSGYRASVERGLGQLGSKVHGAEREKIPYMIIIGDKEEKQRSITVRSRNRMAMEKGMTIEAFLLQLQEEVLSKTLPEKQERQVRR